MRYPAAEKVEVIRLVEASHLPARRTLEKLGIPRATFYRWYDRYRDSGPEALGDRRSRPDRVWNRIPEAIRDEISSTWRSPCPNSAHANWRCASPMRKSTSSQRPRSIDC
jgi:transposase-like protein